MGLLTTKYKANYIGKNNDRGPYSRNYLSLTQN